MTNDRPIDPRWIEWAEQETIRMLTQRTDPDLDEPVAPEPPARLEPEPAEPRSSDDLRLVQEIDLENDPAPEPSPADTRPATRADGLMIKVHRERLDR